MKLLKMTNYIQGGRESSRMSEDSDQETLLAADDVELAFNFVTQELGRNADQDTFEKRIRPMYRGLVQTAQRGETITYDELATIADTDRRSYTSKLLDGISHVEAEHGRPALSVLVVHQNEQRPADAFMEIVERYSLRNQYNADTDEGLINEITEHVFDYWSRK